MSTVHKEPEDCPQRSICTWLENSQLILKELQRLAAATEAMKSETEEIRKELSEHCSKDESRISRLEVKAGLVGAIAGFLAALGTALVHVFR